MAVEGRQAKPHSQQSPPRRAPYSSYGDNKDPRPRSRSPVYGREPQDRRDGREPRDNRDGREPRDNRDGREPRDNRDGREPRDSRDGREPRDSRDGREPRDSRDGREARDSRDGREPRDSRDGRDPGRDPGRELRLGGHSREADYRYRSSESRDKDLRGDPRDPAYSRDDYDRYNRSSTGAEDYFRRKDEPYRDPYRDPWNGRRELEAVDNRVRPEERRRNELYRQYYEELQRRYDTDRPVDCSVIVVNKAQNREYAETVGRKIRDLGMVVDLIFLNTEVSLTQALEDVGRARTPFAIIITQQHQVHRSCTVNILFGTPQEHRNMPIQDAMMLVAHNYDAYKVENREKEREEISRKAAKMADDVLLREADRESHPISVLTAITLLSENRFVTPEELDSLIAYLKDKRARLLRSAADPLTAAVHVGAPAAVHHDIPPSTTGLPPPSHSTHTPPQSSHLGLSAGSSTSTNSSHQQELQAKILSLFNSGTGGSAVAGGGSAASQSQAYGSLGPSASQSQAYGSHGPSASQSQAYGSHGPSTSQSQPYGSLGPSPSQSQGYSSLGPSPSHSQGYGSLGPSPSQNPPRQPMPGPPPSGSQGYGNQLGHMPVTQGGQRPLSSTSGINFDNPSVQKALDTLIQSGPSLKLVSAAASQQPAPGPAPGMGQVPPMSMYPRHY